MSEPLTISELRAADSDHEDTTVASVRRCEAGWEITRSDSWGFLLTDERNPRGIDPKPGQSIRVYGRVGSPIHGVDLDGVNVFWLTPLEREAERAVMRAKFDRQDRERYEAEREGLQKQIDMMPEPFRKRIERFRLDRPEKDRLHEGYEIFCCAEAVVIADIVKREQPDLEPKAAIEWFRDLPYNRQRALGLSDDHSGNTFGGACMLAYRYLEGLEL